MANWRRTRDYRIWRAKVIRRDKRCVFCNALAHREAHHIFSGSYYPEYRFDPRYGVCMCRSCHSMFHNSFMGGTRKKCTMKDYNRFIKLYAYIEKKGAEKWCS